MKISESATKLVLISLMICLEISTLAVIFMNLGKSEVVTPVLSLFSNVIIAVISFYYGQKSVKSNEDKNVT